MALSIEKVAIANRGEVAVRIIRACQELGLSTVLLHSEADRQSLAYRLCDETVCIGPAEVGASYLNIEANIQGALSVGADAIHPGFGFLSENADFAEACAQARLVFVGPSPESIRLFGDKISAKRLVEEAGGPVIPGYQGEDQSLSGLLAKVEEIGYPVMVKAAAGGGGRGLKVIHKASQAQQAIEAAQREGLSAFGSAQVFLEKYLAEAKHIEVQIFADHLGRIYHLFERECSIQRRHQKIIEEALSPSLTEELRSRISQAAVQIAEKSGYRGAGTIEFLLAPDGQFYFLEMNTRLQVEHPVTEMVLGVDLVKAQLLTAMGRSLGWDEEFVPRGHAMECRIYAEDPYRGGMPSTGPLGLCHWPQGPGRRFEVGFERGDEITPYYDSMLAKVIVWDETRARAISKMKCTLQDTVVFGVQTNIPFLLALMEHPEFVSGEMTTAFVERYFSVPLSKPSLTRSDQLLAQEALKGISPGEPPRSRSPWQHSWSSHKGGPS